MGMCDGIPHQQIARYLEAELELNSIPGLTVAIARRGGACSAAFGVKDVTTRVPMEVRTPADLASVSKSFTAAALWQLWKQQRVDLDVPASRFLPELQDSQLAPVTVRQFLRHRSGLPRTGNFLAPYSGAFREPELRTALIKLRAARLRWAPGAIFRYANSNYVVLAALVERISGEPFPSYLRSHLFETIGMSRTTILYKQALDWSLATPHEWQWGRVRPSPPRFFGWYGASLVRSTAEDMGNYLRVWMGELRDGLVPRPGWWNEDTAVRYDWGWFIVRQAGWLRNELVLEHSGDIWGSNAAAVIAPGREVGVAILINMGAERALAIARGVLARSQDIDAPPAGTALLRSRPDYWAMWFVAASITMLILTAVHSLRVVRQVRHGIRRLSREPLRVVRAAVLGFLGIFLVYLLISDFTPPLAVFPATIQIALPLLAVAVAALLMSVGLLGLYPRWRRAG
jgi:CubicO group peptidase (beta-lactamase class C family)